MVHKQGEMKGGAQLLSPFSTIQDLSLRTGSYLHAIKTTPHWHAQRPTSWVILDYQVGRPHCPVEHEQINDIV